MARHYVVSLNADRPHIIHRDPPFGICTVEAGDKKVYVDKVEADELMNSGAAVLCLQCLNKGLDTE